MRPAMKKQNDIDQEENLKRMQEQHIGLHLKMVGLMTIHGLKSYGDLNGTEKHVLKKQRNIIQEQILEENVQVDMQQHGNTAG